MKTLEEMKAELLEQARNEITNRREGRLLKKIMFPLFFILLILFCVGFVVALYSHNIVYFLVPLGAFIIFIISLFGFGNVITDFFKKRISDEELNNEYKTAIIKAKENMLERKAEIPEELVALEEDYKKDFQELKNEYENNCKDLKKEFEELLENYEIICKLNQTI